MFNIREEDKLYLHSLFYGIGVILFWRAIWEVSSVMPLLKNSFFTLFVGLAVLTLTGYIFHEFDPLSRKMHSIGKNLNYAVNRAEHGEKIVVYYHDKTARREYPVDAASIKRVEHDIFVYVHGGREFFVPTNRVMSIRKGKQVIWKL